MKPVEPINRDILAEHIRVEASKENNRERRMAAATGESIAQVLIKLNELIAAHNELLAKYESHEHGLPNSIHDSYPPSKEPEHD